MTIPRAKRTRMRGGIDFGLGRGYSASQVWFIINLILKYPPLAGCKTNVGIEESLICWWTRKMNLF